MEHDESSVSQCEHCGESFVPYRPWQRFCSPPCRDTHYARNVRSACADALRLLDDAMTNKTEKDENRGKG